MLADSSALLVQISLASTIGILSYAFWRSIQSRFPQLSGWLSLCGVITELFFVCQKLDDWAGVQYFAFGLICSAIGAKLHTLSGGKVGESFDSFHLLFLSASTSILVSSLILFMYLPYQYIRYISPAASVVVTLIAIASPAATAFFWLMFHISKPRPGVETHLAP